MLGEVGADSGDVGLCRQLGRHLRDGGTDVRTVAGNRTPIDQAPTHLAYLVVAEPPPEKGYQLAQEVHLNGKVVVLTTSMEHAELKRDQIHAFGPDPFSSKDCKGSMSATIEPAY